MLAVSNLGRVSNLAVKNSLQAQFIDWLEYGLWPFARFPPQEGDTQPTPMMSQIGCNLQETDESN